MRTGIPTFEEFVRPLVGSTPAEIPPDVPLSELAVGDFAVLAWLDDVQRRYSPGAEADLTTRWNSASPHDVYVLLFPGDGARPGEDVRRGAGDVGHAAPSPPLHGVHALLGAEIDRGIETGVQLSVSHRGVTAELAVGDNGNGHAITPDTHVPWTCSSKPLGALAFAGAWEAGALALDTPVVDVLPEFAGGGKDLVKVRDLLTHTTGMDDPMMALDASGAEVASWEEIDEFIWAVICATPTQVLPGTTMIYNPVTNWFVLDRLLNLVAGGRSGDSYRSVLDRLDLSASLGRDVGLGPDKRVEASASEDQKIGLERMRLASELPLPGIGVWGPVRELRLVGEVFLAGGVHRGSRVAAPTTIEALTATHWPGSSRRSICDTDFPYGLGVMTLPGIFGRRCSVRTFGHAGGNTSTLLVDPLFDLVAAVYWNGRLNDVKTVARRYALVRALYDDLGLPELPLAGTKPAVTAGVASADAMR